MANTNNSKKSGKAGTILTVVILLVVVNLFLFVINTVSYGTLTLANGDKVIFGFDRGLGGFLTGKSFNVASDLSFTVKKSDEVLLSGFVDNAEIVGTLESQYKTGRLVQEETDKHKVTYTIYQYDGKYYICGYFDKAPEVGYVAVVEKQTDEDEAVKLLSSLRGNKGVGYYIAWIIGS